MYSNILTCLTVQSLIRQDGKSLYAALIFAAIRMDSKALKLLYDHVTDIDSCSDVGAEEMASLKTILDSGGDQGEVKSWAEWAMANAAFQESEC